MDKEKIKLLLIEDNPGDARLIREFLAEAKGAPFDLYHADRLSAGLERLAQGDIDVILLDLSLPDSQGLDSLSRVNTQVPKVPIVVLSGLSDEAVAVKAVQAGAQDYMVKGNLDSNLLLRSLRYAIERHRLRVELRESESRYRLLADNVADIVWTADAKARITYVSPSIKRLLGYTVDEAMGLKIGDILTADSLEQARRFVTGQMNMRAWGMHYPPASMTLEHVRKDGSTVWAEVMLSFMQSQDGSIVGIMGATRDITERRVAEESLRESETRFRTVFEGTKVGIALIDMFGKPLNINPAFQQMFGYTFEEFRKLTNLEYLHPDDAMVDAKLYIDILKGKLDHYTVDKRYIQKDGGVIWGRQHLSVVRGAEGKPRYFIAMVEDITERKRMEEALRQSEERYRELFENANDIIYTHDLKGNLTSANKAAEPVTGYSGDEVLKMNVFQLVAPESEEQVRQKMTQKLNAGGRTQYELVIIAKDGHKVLIEVSTRLIYQNGKPVGVQGIARDITERKRMEEELRRLSDAVRMSSESITITDLEGTIIDVNEATLKVQGAKSKAELLGLKPYEAIVPEDQEGALRDLAKVMEEGYARDIQYHVLTRDGRRILLETSASLMRGANGEPIGVVAVSRDITERKRMEEALRESEEKYRLCFDNASDVIYLVNPDGMLLTVSPSVEGLLGYTPDELLGHKFLKLNIFSPESLERAVADMGRVLAGERVMSSEREFIAKDGTKRFVEINLAPVTSLEGKVVSIMCAARDITERKRMEEEIHLLSDAVKMSKDSIVIIDLEGRIIEANDATLKMHGMDKRADLIGRLALELIVPQDHEMLTEKMTTALAAGGLPYIIEYHCIKNDGSTSLGEATISEVKDKDGEHTGYMAVVRDITERRRVEEQLRRLSDAFRMSKDSIIITDTQGIVVDFNEATLKLFGVTDRTDFIGKNPADLLILEDLGKGLASMKKAIEEGNVSTLEYSIKKSDGSKLPVEVSASIFRNAKDEPVGFVVVARDVTERKRMEEALRQREQNYLLLLESTFEGMIVVDAETLKVAFGNRRASKMFGFDPILSDGIGLNILDLIHPEDREVVVRGFVEDLHTQERRKKFEVRAKTKDGREIWVDALATRIEFQGRLAVLLSMKDITERRRVEEERRRLEEQIQLAGRLAAVGELAAGVAHELNNPIAAIRGFAQLLNGRKDVDEATKKDLSTIYSEAQRASKITQNLLTFARKHDPAKRLISMNEALEKTLELRAHQMKMNNIELVLGLDAELPETMADFHQMQQVFLNIINNAEQAMVESHGKGRLEVKTEKAGGLIRITFNDDGPGIPEENLEKIFDPFFTTKEVGKGTGLGLSICYGLVEAHGGRIHVRSMPGKGATFVVEIPLVSEDSSSSKARTLNPRSRGMR